MHELAVTDSILNIATEHANKAGARKVTDIFIVIGRLSSIVDDSVQFYWDIVSKDTICAGAQLHFERHPAKILCLDCQTEFELQGDLVPCPQCQSYHLKVISGDQFWLDSIQIEN